MDPIPLMQCPIAGFQFHGGEQCFPRMKAGDPLELRREPGNRHDSRAITVEWNRVMLGYVPREANYTLCQMMDRGAPVAARVAALRDGSDPWQRVMMDIAVGVAPESGGEDRTPVLEEVGLRSGQHLNVPVVRAPLLTPMVPRQVPAAEAALRECVAEIARRLGARLRGLRSDQAREVILWDTLRIRIGADGHGISACHVADGTPFHHDFVTVDLHQPIGPGIWALAFSPLILSTFARHWKPDLGETKRARRWVRDSVELTFEDHIDFESVRQAALVFLAPDPLARSLTNRVFGPGSRVDCFNWLGGRVGPVALCGVEQPAMLPFLRIIWADGELRRRADPAASLHEVLLHEGLEPAAWKWFSRWGFAPFEELVRWSPATVAGFANLLLRLEAQSPPPAEFTTMALHVAERAGDEDGEFDFARLPAWFMRALLRETVRARAEEKLEALEATLDLCVDWLLEASPEPDANQQQAGWGWICQEARAWHLQRELEMLAPWTVPIASLTFPPSYRVVAITSAAELVAEAKAMKNCLADYEDSCRDGEIVIYSIRDQLTDERLACFSVLRRVGSKPWTVQQVAGRKNAKASDKLIGIAEWVAARMNEPAPRP